MLSAGMLMMTSHVYRVEYGSQSICWHSYIILLRLPQIQISNTVKHDFSFPENSACCTLFGVFVICVCRNMSVMHMHTDAHPWRGGRIMCIWSCGLIYICLWRRGVIYQPRCTLPHIPLNPNNTVNYHFNKCFEFNPSGKGRRPPITL